MCLLPMLPLGRLARQPRQRLHPGLAALGPEGLRLRVDWDCLPAAALVGIVPGDRDGGDAPPRSTTLSPRRRLQWGRWRSGRSRSAGMQLYHVGRHQPDGAGLASRQRRRAGGNRGGDRPACPTLVRKGSFRGLAGKAYRDLSHCVFARPSVPPALPTRRGMKRTRLKPPSFLMNASGNYGGRRSL